MIEQKPMIPHWGRRATIFLVNGKIWTILDSVESENRRRKRMVSEQEK